MKRTITLSALIIAGFAHSQNVAINSTGAAPDASAILDIDAAPGNDKGLLFPRVALLATNNALPVTAPANSLVVYNTATSGISPNDVKPGFYFWNGTKWVAFGGNGGMDWSLTGNAGTSAGTNFLGTTDAVDLTIFTNNTEKIRVTSTGNLGIGTPTPAYKLHVANNTEARILLEAGGPAGANNSAIYQMKTTSYNSAIYLREASAGLGAGAFCIDNGINGSEDFGILANGYGYFGSSVGIATATPAAALDVFSPNTGVGQGNAGALLFQIQDGNSRPAISAYGNLDGILPNGTGCAIAVRQTVGTGRSINAAGTINAIGADYAEYFYQANPGSLQKGDVVSLSQNGKVKKSSEGEQIIGIVSTKPGVVGNDVYDQNNPDNTVLVGLVGQVPVNTTTENGPIRIGDYLTPSITKAGYAMKATQPGKIIGIALEALSNGENKVLAYLNIGEGNILSSLEEQQNIIKHLTNTVEELKATNEQRFNLLQQEIAELKLNK